MSEIAANLLIILVFTLIGGFFSAAEIALVSLREDQIQRIGESGSRRSRRLVALAGNPDRFLAAVQVGVTVAGFLSAGFGAARIAPDISPGLQSWGLSPGLADLLAFLGVTLLIAYLSLVLGELVPKRLALQRVEGTAIRTATVVDIIATIARPFIWVLSISADGLLRLLGGDPTIGRAVISEDELRGLVASHEELTEAERALIDDVFAAGDRELREVMIPRTEVEFLQHDMPVFRAAELIGKLPYSRYPIVRNGADDIVGFIHVRDLYRPDFAERGIRVEQIAREVARLPGSRRVIPALTDLRAAGRHLAVVEDEYGGTDGIVTMEDLVEELIGDIRDEYDADEVNPNERSSATEELEIPGLLNLDDFAADYGISIPAGQYETVAGYLVARLGRLPVVGDRVEDGSARYLVIAMDERRIDRIRVNRLDIRNANDPAAAATGEGSAQ